MLSYFHAEFDALLVKASITKTYTWKIHLCGLTATRQHPRRHERIGKLSFKHHRLTSFVNFSAGAQAEAHHYADKKSQNAGIRDRNKSQNTGEHRNADTASAVWSLVDRTGAVVGNLPGVITLVIRTLHFPCRLVQIP